MTDKNSPIRSRQMQYGELVRGRDYNDLRDDLLENHDHNPLGGNRGARVNHAWLTHPDIPEGDSIKYEHKAIDEFIANGDGSNGGFWYMRVNGNMEIETYYENTYHCEEDYDSVENPCKAAHDWYNSGAGACHPSSGHDNHGWFIPLNGTGLDIDKAIVFAQIGLRPDLSHSCAAACMIMPTPVLMEKGLRQEDNLPFLRFALAGPARNESAENIGNQCGKSPAIGDLTLHVLVIGPKK